MDRFLMRISLGYPDRKAEKNILTGRDSTAILDQLSCCVENTPVSHIQNEVDKVHASDTFLTYLQDILEFTRESGEFQIGLSPRAGIALLRASRAWAYLLGRDYTIPEDLQEILPWTAGHRLRFSRDLGQTQPRAIMDLFSQVPVPV
jgi:MoxR-like ATPase